MKFLIPDKRLGERELEIAHETENVNGPNLYLQGGTLHERLYWLVQFAVRLRFRSPDTAICIIVSTCLQVDWILSRFEAVADYGVYLAIYREAIDASSGWDVVFLFDASNLSCNEAAHLRKISKRVVFAASSIEFCSDSCCALVELAEIFDPKVLHLGCSYIHCRRLIEIARAILPVEQFDPAPSGRMQGLSSMLIRADSYEQEIEWIWKNCQRCARAGEPAVVVVQTHKAVMRFVTTVSRFAGLEPPCFCVDDRSSRDYRAVNAMLEQGGIPLQYLGNGYGGLRASDKRPLTYVMGYPSVIGLSFETVFLPHLNNDQPFWWKDTEVGRRLFFCGATLSRKNLILSYSSSEPHDYVKAIPQDLLYHDTCQMYPDINDLTKFYF